MNILCNPTGHAGKFRAIDWWVEHNNLFLKVSCKVSLWSAWLIKFNQRIYGGKLSNHTKARIIKESPLIEVFKNTRIQMEKMFHLDHRTIQHSPTDLTNTFTVLAAYMQKEKANVFVTGCSTRYTIPDTMKDGMHIGMTKAAKAVHGEDSRNEEDIGDNNEEGELEVEDDGDLDV